MNLPQDIISTAVICMFASKVGWFVLGTFQTNESGGYPSLNLKINIFACKISRSNVSSDLQVI